MRGNNIATKTRPMILGDEKGNQIATKTRPTILRDEKGDNILRRKQDELGLWTPLEIEILDNAFRLYLRN